MLFVDIETVSAFKTFDEVPERFKPLWHRKATSIDKTHNGSLESAANLYQSRAAIYAEFAKVCCISCGYIKDGKLRIKSIYDHDEMQILEQFSDLLIHYYADPQDYYLCGHNIKEFDIPFLCRRMVMNGIFMPNMLDLAGKKPWQTEHLVDTMDLWRFGDYKAYTSLNLLTAALDIPSPKDDIDGSMVGTVYWDDDDLERIAVYCEKDVISLAQIMMRFCGKPLISDENISIARE